MKYLVTGCAGFIGSHIASHLSQIGNQVSGIDNFTPYYSIEMKHMRADHLLAPKGISVINCDLSNFKEIKQVIEKVQPEIVVHLAAQAGVRLPIKSGQKYLDSNINGFYNLFLATQDSSVKSVVYASSSSVYGDDAPTPFRESWKGLTPKSLYAATKLANEAMASVLARELRLRVRGLRFFTVYGEWGRPDMAYFRIGASALHQVPFTLFGDGSIERDFTYVGDVVTMTTLLAEELETRPIGYSDVVNIGGGRPLSMDHLIKLFQEQFHSNFQFSRTKEIGVDSKRTMASTEYLESLIGMQSFTTLEEGVTKFVTWLRKEEINLNLEKWVRSTY